MYFDLKKKTIKNIGLIIIFITFRCFPWNGLLSLSLREQYYLKRHMVFLMQKIYTDFIISILQNKYQELGSGLSRQT